MTESILQEAQRIIHGDRAKNYGHPRENFQNIADLWSAYKGVEFTSMDVGLMMVLLKVARLQSGDYHRDSVTDIAGYAGTLERIFEEPGSEAADKVSGLVGAWVDTAPRVWESLDDVPLSAVVRDSGGDRWVYRNGRWTCFYMGKWDEDINDDHRYAPFTEVVA